MNEENASHFQGSAGVDGGSAGIGGGEFVVYGSNADADDRHAVARVTAALTPVMMVAMLTCVMGMLAR
eukprot:170714-Rhodomonas_salina.1